MGDNMAKASAATNKVSAFSAASMFDELALGPPRILTGAVKRSNDAKNLLFKGYGLYRLDRNFRRDGGKIRIRRRH